jgi:hypothetical protein
VEVLQLGQQDPGIPIDLQKGMVRLPHESRLDRRPQELQQMKRGITPVPSPPAVNTACARIPIKPVPPPP